MIKWDLFLKRKVAYNIHKSSVIHCINKMKDKNHTIILIGAEKAFDKIRHPFVIKTLSKEETEGTHLSVIRAAYDTPTANIRHNWQKLPTFSLR